MAARLSRVVAEYKVKRAGVVAELKAAEERLTLAPFMGFDRTDVSNIKSRVGRLRADLVYLRVEEKAVLGIERRRK